jgi:curli biogenesis system outer membrane secretion channel CsgG
MTNKQLFALTASLFCVSLTGCSKSADEPAPVENAVDAAEPLPRREAPRAPSPVPAATAPATVNSTAEVPPEDAPPPDEQMMDDAAATGMTARAPREEVTTESAESGELANQN